MMVAYRPTMGALTFNWKLGLGIYLTVNGFTPSPIASAYDREVGHAAV
jgi:hypothetical protein